MQEHRRPETAMALFRSTAALMVTELVERLAAAGYEGISGNHHAVFENIDPRGTRLKVLAARAELTHQSMSELVMALEQRGYLERRPDPTDGRARLVRLTPMGHRMIRQARREIARIEGQWEVDWRSAGLTTDLRPVLGAALVRHEAASAGEVRSSASP